MSQYKRIAGDFFKLAKLTGIKILPGDIEVQELSAPHRQPSCLPKGKQAIYVFMSGNGCLKVGKVGPKAGARFCSHHYGSGRAPNTLAKCILNNQSAVGATGLDATNIKG